MPPENASVGGRRRRRPFRRGPYRSAPFVAALLCAAAASAQTSTRPAPTAQAPAAPNDLTFVDRVEVPRVLVDLIAVQNGEPVLDLRADELRVYEDGHQVEILGFDPPRSASAAGRPAVPTPASETPGTAGSTSEETTHILLIDDLHTRLNDRKRLLKALRPAVEELAAGGAGVMIVSFDGRLHLRLPRTEDPREIRRALDFESRRKQVPMLAAMADTERAILIIEQRMKDETLTPGGGSFSGMDPCVDIGGLARTHAEQADAVVDSSLAGIRHLVGTLARFPGRKSLLYVSGGIPLVPGLEVFTYAMEMCDGTAARDGNQAGVDTQEFKSGKNTRWDPRTARLEVYQRNTTSRWQEIAAYANAQQVSFYPIDARGLIPVRASGVANARTTGSYRLVAQENPRDALSLVAKQTGGSTFFDSNDFAQAARESLADADATYRLSFEPMSKADDRTHDIRVEVSRPGVELRHRRSYRALSRAARLHGTVMAALLHGSSENPLRVRTAEEAVAEPDAGKRAVKLRVEVPLEALTMIPSGTERAGRFTVVVGGEYDNGTYMPIGMKTIDVKASEVDRQSQSFVYEVEVPLRRKSATLSITVRDEVGDLTSTLLRSVEES